MLGLGGCSTFSGYPASTCRCGLTRLIEDAAMCYYLAGDIPFPYFPMEARLGLTDLAAPGNNEYSVE